MCKSCLFIILTVCINTMNAQIQIVDNSLNAVFSTIDQDRSEYIVEDIDGDGVLDSLYYNFKDEAFKIKLSDRKYDVLSMDYPIYSSFSIDVVGNMLYIYHWQMRYTENLLYRFDTLKYNYQLVYSSSESYGTATNDGAGTRNIDFMTGEYTADYYYFDNELDSLISLPTIDLAISLSPIYMNDTIYSEYIPSDIFSYYKERHIIEERLKNINIKEILTLEDLHVLSSVEIESTSIDSLMSIYGKNMGYDNDFTFSFNNLKKHSSYDYTSSIIPLFTDQKVIVYLIYFSFCKPTYFVCYLDKETLENRYIEYGRGKNIELNKIILNKLPNNYYPIRDN